MTLVERVGHDEVWGRDLFVMSIPKSEDLPRELSVPSRGAAGEARLTAWQSRVYRYRGVTVWWVISNDVGGVKTHVLRSGRRNRLS